MTPPDGANAAEPQPATPKREALLWNGQVLVRTNSREIRELQAARRADRETAAGD